MKGIVQEVQKRFAEKFGYLRCSDLLEHEVSDLNPDSSANAMNLTHYCDIVIVTAAEIVEELLAEGWQEEKTV